MNRSFLLISTIFIIIIGYIFNLDRVIKNNLSQIGSNVSSAYLNTLVSIESSINKYFYQIDYIEQLKKQNDQFVKYKTLYDTASAELNEVKNTTPFVNEDNLLLQKVKVLSNHSLYDPSIVVLDLEESNSLITAMITEEGYSAGIIIKKNQQYLAYLNSNSKCNYAVFVGEQNAPGITSGMNDKGLLKIDHIPKWKQINIDDEIITSNMDNIFPYGIKVAKVISIRNGENTKTVFAKPYGDTVGKRFFYTIKTLPENNSENNE
jgi:rod shape-determining protein MreC